MRVTRNMYGSQKKKKEEEENANWLHAIQHFCSHNLAHRNIMDIQIDVILLK